MIAELLATCPQLKALVTSRARLHLLAEHEFSVPPLPVPASSRPGSRTPDALLQFDAIRLFITRGQAVKPDFSLNEANGVHVAEICARLEGLPVSLELAAARVKVLPPAALLARLDHRLAFLMVGAAEAYREKLGAPVPPCFRAWYATDVALVRATLGPVDFAAGWSDGRMLLPEQAVASISADETPPKPVPAGRAAYPAGLTAREVDVLRLVAQGLSDAQVADRLVVSVRTVNGHLQSVYRKLGVSSRAAATRFAVEHRLV
jgi:DNA-binding CsgD family transcriptional regulator